jgi:Gnt-I system high-affinity gluconate transporter
MPLILTLIAILVLILLVSVVKLDTFISFILVAIGLGLANQLEIPVLSKAIQSGVGNTLGELTLIIGFGAMLGKLVASSGASEQITNKIITVFKDKYLTWGLALAGFIIGLPLFYNAGFVIVIPLIFAISQSTKLPILYVGIPMLSALSVAHGYLPPHPSPAAIATQLNADLGKTLFYGIMVAIPAIAVAGPLFGSTLKKYKPEINTSLFANEKTEITNPPGIGISFFVALLPVFLLTYSLWYNLLIGILPASMESSLNSLSQTLKETLKIHLLIEPNFSLLISVLVAIYFLGIKQGKTMPQIGKLLEEAFKNVAPILLIIAGSGALKEIFIVSGTSKYIAGLLLGIDINPLILGWAIAGLIRVCVGSATIAGLTAVGVLLPMIQAQTGLSPELMVLAIGSGSLMFSHINDGGFWLFKEYFNLSIKDTIKTWSIMETIVSIIGLLGVLVLDQVI